MSLRVIKGSISRSNSIINSYKEHTFLAFLWYFFKISLLWRDWFQKSHEASLGSWQVIWGHCRVRKFYITTCSLWNYKNDIGDTYTFLFSFLSFEKSIWWRWWYFHSSILRPFIPFPHFHLVNTSTNQHHDKTVIEVQ